MASWTGWVPRPPRDSWVLLDFLASWAFLGVLDIGDPQAPLYLKKSQATLEKRAKEDCKGSLAPKAPWEQWGEPGCKGDFGEKSPLEPEGSETSLATPRGTPSLLKGKRGGLTASYRILAPRAETRQTEGGGGPMGRARPGFPSQPGLGRLPLGPAGPYLLISSGSLAPPRPLGGDLGPGTRCASAFHEVQQGLGPEREVWPR